MVIVIDTASHTFVTDSRVEIRVKTGLDVRFDVLFNVNLPTLIGNPKDGSRCRHEAEIAMKYEKQTPRVEMLPTSQSRRAFQILASSRARDISPGP